MDKQTASKVLDDARAAIAGIIIGHDSSLVTKPFEKADKILAISGTTDIECYACAFDKKMLGLRPLRCDPCGTTGTIKHKWKVSVTLENGEILGLTT